MASSSGHVPFPWDGQAPPETIAEEHAPADGPADTHTKPKGRQRLLQGISRISSSPSLAQLGRARSASTPYPSRVGGASLSCVSLASAASPFSPPSASSAGSGFAFSPLGSPGLLASAPSSVPSLCSQPWRVELEPGGPDSVAVPAGVQVPRVRKTFGQLWAELPRELQVCVLQRLAPKQLVRLSRTSRSWHALCFDGQLWASFDASDFYQDIPARSLGNIIARAGPFVRSLNLRGCVQVEGFDTGQALAQACANLEQATLEGSQIDGRSLEALLRRNGRLERANLTGLGCVDLSTCVALSQGCPRLTSLNLSWCKGLTANMLVPVVHGCAALRDLRVGELRGFDNLQLARALFTTNRLERLVLAGCADLTDAALCMLLHGPNPELDPLTDRPMVPPRRLRHLDLSRCRRLTGGGVAALGHCVPDLEALVLAGCGASSGGGDGPNVAALADAALEPILASTPRLAYLDLEDLAQLTNNLLSQHLARAPCVTSGSLRHLSLSYCEEMGDAGLLPLLRACPSLRSLDMDNTRISDLVLVAAAAMVGARPASSQTPSVGLSLAVYDCPNVTWTGVREVMSRNAEALGKKADIITLKCYYGWQMTVDEHTKRVLHGNRAAASRLERKWAGYMQATEEAGAGGAGNRRRRRRAREAQQAHATEEVGLDVGGGIGRRRARTTACVVM